MPMNSPVKVTLAAAALLAASTTPALAKGGHTRSFESLPSAKSHSAYTSRSSGYTSRGGHGSNHGNGFAFGGGYGPNHGGNFGGQGHGFGRFGGIAAIFGYLPPNVQQAIADALDDAGPRGDRLCRLLGIPGCQIPDSTG